jgi:mannose-6-phosphate isomerase-like protein (cupin superfamily)
VNAKNPIPDVFLLDLEREGERLVILKDTHHLLRRFGQVEYVELKAGEETPFALRVVADEIWSVIAGEVLLSLVDKRQGSPSENKSMQFKLSETRPQAVLVPFGVAFHFKAVKTSQLIRIATHEDGTHEEDRILSQDEVDLITLST